MAEATWGEDEYEDDDEPPEPPIHTKEELVRALFRADKIINGDWTAGGIHNKMEEMNAAMAQHARFMREGEEYQDFIKVQQKLEMEEAVG